MTRRNTLCGIPLNEQVNESLEFIFKKFEIKENIIKRVTLKMKYLIFSFFDFVINQRHIHLRLREAVVKCLINYVFGWVFALYWKFNLITL
jgi:hypothetical protein